MTIPVGPVSLSQVKAEFGIFGPTTATNLRAYQRSATITSGTYVGPTPYTTPISTTGNLSLLSFGGTSNNASTPWSNTFTTAITATVTIPPETRTVIIESWGGGGGGGRSRATTPPFNAGGGGGGGAYASYTVNLPTPYSNYWGQTFNYTVGAGGISAVNGTSSTVSGGTFSPFTLLYAGGGNTGSNGGNCCVTPGGSGGVAGGGPSGSTLRPGTVGNCGNGPVAGTGACSAIPILTPTVGHGGTGGTGNGGAGTAGGCGAVRFTWK